MKFNVGDLVSIVSVTGKVISGIPPALILSSSMGYSNCPEGNKYEKIYTILYMGVIDKGVASEWLSLISNRP